MAGDVCGILYCFVVELLHFGQEVHGDMADKCEIDVYAREKDLYVYAFEDCAGE